MKVTNISPYQTRGGITKDTAFFGREKILAQILNREHKNYLLVGGRQIGKSSLLKQIERRYQNHPRVECLYISLSRDDLQQLNPEFCLARNATVSDLLEKLADVPPGKHRLLLLDETDLFIQSEIKKGYPTLKHFRSLSEEGRCHFIMAGFWKSLGTINLTNAYFKTVKI